ncbi:unnamed protein product, partial [Laminaria digitata]
DATEFTQFLVPFLEQSLNNLRQRMDSVLPDLHKAPAEWFRFWDEDESGSLERREIVRALMKTVPALTGRDEEWLLGTFRSIWAVIDPNQDGMITEAEFMMEGGLYETLLANYFHNVM